MVTPVTNSPGIAGPIPAVGGSPYCMFASDNTYASGVAVMAGQSDGSGNICVFGVVSHNITWRSYSEPGSSLTAGVLAEAIVMATAFAANGFE